MILDNRVRRLNHSLKSCFLLLVYLKNIPRVEQWLNTTADLPKQWLKVFAITYVCWCGSTSHYLFSTPMLCSFIAIQLCASAINQDCIKMITHNDIISQILILTSGIPMSDACLSLTLLLPLANTSNYLTSFFVILFLTMATVNLFLRLFLIIVFHCKVPIFFISETN